MSKQKILKIISEIKPTSRAEQDFWCPETGIYVIEKGARVRKETVEWAKNNLGNMNCSFFNAPSSYMPTLQGLKKQQRENAYWRIWKRIDQAEAEGKEGPYEDLDKLKSYYKTGGAL